MRDQVDYKEKQGNWKVNETIIHFDLVVVTLLCPC